MRSALKRSFSFSSICFWILVFLIPIGLLVAALALSDVYPFGTRSFLVHDLRYQYIDFFTWFRSVLLGDGSLFYSSAQALGNNEWGLFSYYLSSPFNLLVVFFPEDRITDFVVLVSALKLGCTGVTGTWYLVKRFSLRKGYALPLAMGYAWSLWSIVWFTNLLWMDALIILPLVMLGLYGFVRKGRWRLLLVSLCLMVITNWYMAYMVILFSFIFIGLELYLVHVEEQGAVSVQVVLQKLLVYAGLVLISLLICSFTFLPTIAAMGSSPTLVLVAMVVSVLLVGIGLIFLNGENPFGRAAARFAQKLRERKSLCRILLHWTPRVILLLLAVIAAFALICPLFGGFDIVGYFINRFGNCSLEGLFSALYLGNQPSGGPQIFCGTLVLLLAVLMFCTRSIPWKAKAALAFVLAIMLFSTWFRPLYVAWCGFRSPNGFYCRIGFLVAFLFVFMAAYSLKRFQEGRVRSKELIAAGGLVVVLGALIRVFGGTSSAVDLAISLALVICLTAVFCFALYAGQKRSLQILLSAVMVVCVTGELTYYAQSIWEYIYVGYTQEQHDRYIGESREQLNELESHDGSLYRIEKTHTRIDSAALNEGLAEGFMQLSSYSSAHNIDAVNFLAALGYSNEGEFSVRYAEPILLTDALLGVRYVVDDERPLGFKDPGFEATNLGKRFYENPFSLSLGYEVSGSVADSDFSEESNPYERQNELMSSLIGEDVQLYWELDSKQAVDEQGCLVWQVEVPEGTIGYAYALVEGVEWSDPLWMTIDGQESIFENTRFEHCLHVINDSFDTADSVRVALTSEKAGGGSASENPPIAISTDDPVGSTQRYPAFASVPNCLFYGLDFDAATEALQKLREKQFSPSLFEDGHIVGTYKAEHDSYLLLTVPNEEGWKLTVNGSPVQPKGAYQDALMLIPVFAGENRIELTFVSPGFMLGSSVTALTIVGFSLVSAIARKRRISVMQ